MELVYGLNMIMGRNHAAHCLAYTQQLVNHHYFPPRSQTRQHFSFHNDLKICKSLGLLFLLLIKPAGLRGQQKGHQAV